MLRHYVLKHLRLAWSPQQISGKLKAMSDPDANGPSLPVVSHETIYRAIYGKRVGSPTYLLVF